MRITTESGAVYETTKAGDRVRRLRKRNPIDPGAEVDRATAERDGLWLDLFQPLLPRLGLPLQVLVWQDGTVSVRTTTVVVGIEH